MAREFRREFLFELELELILSQMAQKPMLRGKVGISILAPTFK